MANASSSAELREVELQRPRDLLHRLDLGGAAHPAHRVADVDGRADARVEQVRLEEHLPVRDGDHVRRDVGGDVARLGLDDRQRGEAIRRRARRTAWPPAPGAGNAGRRRRRGRRLALPRGRRSSSETAVVGLGLLREVVVDDQRVLAILHPVLAHGAAGVGRQVLVGGRVSRRGNDHHRVLECLVVLERGHRLGHRGVLLPDGHVDALHALAGLVDDGVDRHGRLARLAVADDQLAPAAAHGCHGVDGLDAGLQGLAHGLAADDARGLHLHAARLCRIDGTLAVERLTERIHDASQEGVADGTV